MFGFAMINEIRQGNSFSMKWTRFLSNSKKTTHVSRVDGPSRLGDNDNKQILVLIIVNADPQLGRHLLYIAIENQNQVIMKISDMLI